MVKGCYGSAGRHVFGTWYPQVVLNRLNVLAWKVLYPQGKTHAKQAQATVAIRIGRRLNCGRFMRSMIAERCAGRAGQSSFDSARLGRFARELSTHSEVDPKNWAR